MALNAINGQENLGNSRDLIAQNSDNLLTNHSLGGVTINREFDHFAKMS